MSLLRRYRRMAEAVRVTNPTLLIQHRLVRKATDFFTRKNECLRCHRSGAVTDSVRTRNYSTALSPTPDENQNVPAVPIDFATSSVIKGEESNVAFVTLKEGQILRAESGAMVFMTEGITMDTKLAGASNAFSRFLTGQNVFLTDFKYKSERPGQDSGTLALGTDFPSKIIRLNLEEHPNQSLICQRGAFLASNPTVNIQTEFTQSLSAGFFGGQGFILQRLTGEGDVLIKAGGTLVRKELEEGEVLRVTSGSIVAFQSSCQYNVQMMPGIKNALFGGEGLFITTLTGPGLVWLQGMPADRMIAEIARRVPAGSGIGWGVPIGGSAGGASGDETGDSGEGGVDGNSSGVGDAAALGEGSAAAASDAAIEGDRQATVASSGGTVDSNSQEALFGDAVPKDHDDIGTNNAGLDDLNSTTSSFPPQEDTTTFSSSTSEDSSFSTFEGNDGFEESFGNEFGASNDFSSPEEGPGPADGELFDDTSTGAGMGDDADSQDEGNGLFGALWDFFSGGGDD